jgi:hypothetical protein
MMDVRHCRLSVVDCGWLPQCVLAALCFLVLLVGGSGAAHAQEDDSVELGREAFSRRNYPWYEPREDAVRPLRVGKKTSTQTEAKPGKSRSKDSKTSSSSGAWGLSLFGSALQVVGLLLLTLVLVAVAALIVWAFLRNETTQAQGASVVSASREVDRVEQLPFALKRTGGDFLAEARRLAEAGNYSEAVIYLYSHLLVELDKHHVIRLAKGKTNRQYLRETRPRPALAEILEPTMVAFEDVFFGHHELEQNRFEQCAGQIAQFDVELARLERAAA